MAALLEKSEKRWTAFVGGPAHVEFILTQTAT
jgi:hypothetical protein